MELSDKHQRQFATWYIFCFLLWFAWLLFHGLLFTSLSPVFFVNRPDVTLNILMLTDVQGLLIKYKGIRILSDTVYLLLPVMLVIAVYKKRFNRILATATIFFHLVYSLLLSSMSVVSAETFVAWMTVPVIFYARSVNGFYYLLHLVRIFFLIIFFTAGLWKLRTGAIFNTEQMSGILLRQHASYLANESGTIYRQMILYLVNNIYLSYFLYVSAFFAEISFGIGFFTKKYDRSLIVFFCLFLLFNYIVMGINYSAWFAFLGCLYFSGYGISKENRGDNFSMQKIFPGKNTNS